MEILTRTELKLRYQQILKKITEGAIFIYPTDTIYGIGCDATNAKSVEKIRKLKERPDTPLSVWVPSVKWIENNCITNKEVKESLKELPGSVTLIMGLKNKKAVADNVSPGLKTIGIRIPDHWFNKVVADLNLPIITTSANRAGQPFMTSIENLDQKIEVGIEFLIYEGEKTGKPSKIVDLVKKEVKER
ncbi:MAG: threonylcarbamoyl-AMP synthase [Nanoarchaeota archaeon]|nr:threonylcarbamoyl-AMP synthase [Nanoarchaeota archaeon]MBU1644205.1 threonylcarbamoyl-AMP synthase [Nanoarchaeota archaeon]MBU1976736.1 threonylcarbamoyl-AMP synthase [Nanoarchaeota archaeon]